MEVAFWETRRHDLRPARRTVRSVRVRGLPRAVAEHVIGRQCPPVPLLSAHLAAVFSVRGCRVRRFVDRLPRRADLTVVQPNLWNLDAHRQAIAELRRRQSTGQILVVGPVADRHPGLFEDLDVTIIKGEPERMHWQLEGVLQHPGAIIQLGQVEDLDALPMPDWAPFSPWLFRSTREFWRFPTAEVEFSRDAPSTCPTGGEARCRQPEAVLAEIVEGIGRWGFYSFRFTDPEFGQDVGAAYHLVEQLRRLQQPIQFSVRSRPEFLRPEMIRALRQVGLTCVRFPVDVGGSVAEHAAFAATCRRAGIRTIAEFPPIENATAAGVDGWSLKFAWCINPTFAEFAGGGSPCQADRERSTRHELEAADDLVRYRNAYYARRDYWRENLSLLFPVLGRLSRRRPRDRSPKHTKGSVPKPTMLGQEGSQRRRIRRDGPHEAARKTFP